MFDLDPHLIRQATKRQLKRGNAFGFVSHEGLLLISVPPFLHLLERDPNRVGKHILGYARFPSP